MVLRTLITLTWLLVIFGVASGIPYETYILAPRSRELKPVSVKDVRGTVKNSEALLDGKSGTATFEGDGWVTLDYGKNIGGLLSIDVEKVSGEGARIGITFSESPVFISVNSSDGQSDGGRGEKIYLTVTPDHKRFTLPEDRIRGGFRYVSLSTSAGDTVEVNAVTTYFTPVSHRDPRDYTGYFHSSDELLNRIWYAGESNFGGRTAEGTYTWSLNTTVCEGIACVVDGAKRDRLVWPGDLVVQVQTMAVSTYDMEPLRVSLESLFFGQAANGMLPYLGWDFQGRKHGYVSFTYHLHNLNSLAHYVRYSGDNEYLAAKWPAFVKAINWSLSHIDSTGLMLVTSNRDWLRAGMGGHNIEANAILYYTLQLGIQFALQFNDTQIAGNWSTYAQTIKKQANTLLWDPQSSLYFDNETTTLHPQDGNVWAIVTLPRRLLEQRYRHSSVAWSARRTYLFEIPPGR
nr:uncharacterized protein CTRU02_14596 [Colletotrichum truncatum]KAF6782040.1 hypothetical protein CTRU02_14596 [Colletotrichum truncatum]